MFIYHRLYLEKLVGGLLHKMQLSFEYIAGGKLYVTVLYGIFSLKITGELTTVSKYVNLIY
jgi:hypothetical protein